MGKTLYLECYSGISGDMTVGALLDLGAREEALREALEALPLNGYEITIGRTKKCGIDACDFDVILEEEEGQEPLHHHGGEAHTHDYEHGSGNHSHGRHSLTAHCHGDEAHTHDDYMHHEHSHGEKFHDHPHTHGPEAYDHHHDHVHRHYADIMHMLDEAPLKQEVRALAKKIFRIVGEARDFDALKEITAQRKTILLLALTALTISVLAALLLTYHISTPILALSNIMKKVGAGDFKVDVPVYKGHDEVAILYSNFKNMLEMRERLTEEVYGAKVREKEAELRTLQAQINPHFLYNTLDSINWMAVKYGADDIEEMVTDLSQMLRYSLNNGVNQLKVSEELTQIRCYLNIQQKRFSNSFSTSYEIDPEVLDYQVIKLLLQPLVENALQHGFDESGQTGKLMLRVKKKENNIEFSVLNNGNKMDLEKVKQALQLPEDAKPTSYGLRNVNDRLVKYYGAKSGLQFSIEGDYSCARFTIPAQL